MLEKEYFAPKIEKKWFDIWEETKPFKVDDNSEKPKYFALSIKYSNPLFRANLPREKITFLFFGN